MNGNDVVPSIGSQGMGRGMEMKERAAQSFCFLRPAEVEALARAVQRLSPVLADLDAEKRQSL